MDHYKLCHPYWYINGRYHRLLAKILNAPRGRVDIMMGKGYFPCNFAFAEKRVRAMYFRTYEHRLVCALRKYVKAGDVFVDAGANIGYITAVAAGLVGATGEVHSFEPVPRYFEYLSSVRSANPSLPISINNCALGDRESTSRMTVCRANIGGSSMVPGFIREESAGESIEVKVERLDAYLGRRGISRVDIVKIDTEGYELHVLKGLTGYLDSGWDHRPLIFLEYNPKAMKLLGMMAGDWQEFMEHYAYTPCLLCGCKVSDFGAIDRQANLLLKPARRNGRS
jgi:FkbM family methyltransferase